MARMAISLLPREERFFDQFERICATLVEGARTLAGVVGEPGSASSKITRLRELEHEADEITHETLDRLNRTFLTPFDREDIDAMARMLDDMMDYLEEAGQRIGIYRIESPREDATRLSELPINGAEELQKLFRELPRHKKNKEKIRQHLLEIHRIENQGDVLLRSALSRLFEEEGLSPVDLLKWKDVYELIETSTDMCEKISHVVDAILVKHA